MNHSMREGLRLAAALSLALVSGVALAQEAPTDNQDDGYGSRELQTAVCDTVVILQPTQQCATRDFENGPLTNPYTEDGTSPGILGMGGAGPLGLL